MPLIDTQTAPTKEVSVVSFDGTEDHYTIRAVLGFAHFMRIQALAESFFSTSENDLTEEEKHAQAVKLAYEFITAWSHDAPITIENIARIPSGDMVSGILPEIADVLRESRGVTKEDPLGKSSGATSEE